VQARGAATVTAILDACQGLLNERDYDSITTARIAESAGIPIGSYLPVLPDKRSVVRALALRCTDKFLVEVEPVLHPGRRTGRLAAGGRGRARRARANVQAGRNFGRVRFAEVLDNHLEDPEQDHRRMVADRLGALFATRYKIRKGAGYRLGSGRDRGGRLAASDG